MIKMLSYSFVLENQNKPGLWLKLQVKSQGMKHTSFTLLPWGLNLSTQIHNQTSILQIWKE